MGRRKMLGKNVWEEAVARMEAVYRAGHRVVVSFSGGKDSTCVLHVCLEAAKRTGRLPVEVVHRDEEICLPGTFDYCERVAARPDVNFHWYYSYMAQPNIWNRSNPWYWTFDPEMDPDKWMRKPPVFAQFDSHACNQQTLSRLDNFPPAPGKHLVQVIGIRIDESRYRMMSIYSSKGFLSKPHDRIRTAKPIYDWRDKDVWLAMAKFKWDYNKAYDVLYKLGFKAARMRIGPVTTVPQGADMLEAAAKAWPRWFDRLCVRCPGTRNAARFGKKLVQPRRKLNESWEECFWRECVEEAPDWIALRSAGVIEAALAQHARHSSGELPQAKNCGLCTILPSWKEAAHKMWSGDPLVLLVKVQESVLPPMDPEDFRPGGLFHEE